MIEKIIDLLHIAARNLERPTETMPPDSEQEEAEEHPAPSSQITSDQPEDDVEPRPSLWQRFIVAERERLGWLRSQPYIAAITIGLAIAIVIGERWLINAWDWLTC